jgi:competence protein ComEA
MRAHAPPAIALGLLVLAAASPFAAASPARAGKAVDGVVNLNTAAPEVLGLLPGIGPAKAAEIATYRKRHPFRTVDELVRIKGIGRKMVRRLRPHLAVAGPTTAHAITDAAARAAALLAETKPPVPPPVPHPGCPKPASLPPPRGLRNPARERWPAHGACLRPR